MKTVIITSLIEAGNGITMSGVSVNLKGVSWGHSVPLNLEFTPEKIGEAKLKMTDKGIVAEMHIEVAKLSKIPATYYPALGIIGEVKGDKISGKVREVSLCAGHNVDRNIPSITIEK